MRRSSIVVLIIILLLLAGGGVTAYLLLRGEGKASFNFGNGSVVGAKIEFHGLTLSQNGNNLTLTGTYDNKSKSKGNVYVTIQAISKTSEQSMTFTVPVTSGSGKSFAQKKTTSMKLESAALGSLFFQGTGSSGSSGSSGVNQSSGSTNGGTYPWESQSGTIAPTPQQSSATNSFENYPPGSQDTVPGVETLPYQPESSTTTP
jgi:hypothetical protein